MKRLLLILMLFTTSFALWRSELATGELCFDAEFTEDAFGVTGAEPLYDVIIIGLPLNNTFWDRNLTAYNYDTSTWRPLFRFADNGTHVFVMMPVVEDLLAGNPTTWCIYSGYASNESAALVAPYNMGFSNYNELTTYFSAVNDTAYTLTNDNGIINISSSGTVGFHGIYAPTTKGNMAMMYKMRIDDHNESDTNSIAGAWTGYYNIFTYNSQYGIGARGTNFTHGWYGGSIENLNISDDKWNIFRFGLRLNDAAAAGYYNSSYILNTTTSVGIGGSNVARLNETYPVYIRNASARYEHRRPCYYRLDA
jgi:hypothetical protein